jgi:hypothetical protein
MMDSDTFFKNRDHVEDLGQLAIFLTETFHGGIEDKLDFLFFLFGSEVEFGHGHAITLHFTFRETEDDHRVELPFHNQFQDLEQVSPFRGFFLPVFLVLPF